MKVKNWIAISIFVLFAIVPMFGCAVYEPLSGLCYTDKTGTYVCLAEHTEKLPVHYTKEAREHCSHLMGEDLYFVCMDQQLKWKEKNG
jgi:hypothetical protein